MSELPDFNIYETTDEKSFELEKIQQTDLGNAERLVELYGKDFRYCCPVKKFLIWNGNRWNFDVTMKIARYAKQTIRNMYQVAAEESNDEERRKIVKHAKGSEANYRLKAMIELAKTEFGVPILPDQLDSDFYKLNCLNGTIDLNNSKLKEHNRDDFITKICPVEFDFNAECPRWLEFLTEIMNDDQELIKWIQKAVGYSASGDTPEQCWFLLYGSGANGKSTFLNVIRSILNDYAQNTPTETFLIRNNEAIPNDLAGLRGARFVTSFEPAEGRHLNESRMKELTGGDPITARFLFSEYFDFVPQFKIWISANHKPQVTGSDYATWRRIRMIPFEIQIPEEKRIKDYAKILFQKEGSGILNWIVEGFALWRLEGLGSPPAVRQATLNYQTEMDDISSFLRDFCEVTDKLTMNKIDIDSISKYDLQRLEIKYMKANDLYKAYTNATGDKTYQKTFNIRLKERGFTSKRFTDGYNWIGIGLKNDKV